MYRVTYYFNVTGDQQENLFTNVGDALAFINEGHVDWGEYQLWKEIPLETFVRLQA